MTDTQPPAAARDAARSEARRMIAGLMPGQTGINLANEIADAVLDAAWTHIAVTSEQHKTRRILGACACGRIPDPGICPTSHDNGLSAGGHCACVHDKEKQ